MKASIRSAAGSALLIALYVAPLFAQSVPQQQPARSTLPVSLTNAEFWSIISEFSEDAGQFPSENFTSNEMQVGQVAADLVSRGRTGGAYLGVGPEQNFTYIAALKPDIVFIVDIRRQAVMQHLMYKAIFEMSANRSEFLSRLFSLPLQTLAPQDTSIRDLWLKYHVVPPDSALYSRNAAAIHQHLVRQRGFPLAPADSLSIAQVYSVFYYNGPRVSYSSRVVGVPGNPSSTGIDFLMLSLISDTNRVARSFLASEANYQTVRALHMKNLFIPVVGNFGGPRALRKVGDYLRAHDATVNAHYVSNVEGYLFRPPLGGPPLWNEYYTSIGLLPLDSSSVFIRTNSLGVSRDKMLSLLDGIRPVSPSSPNAAPFIAFEVVPRQPPAPAADRVGTLGSISGTVIDSASGRGIGGGIVQMVTMGFGANTAVSGQYVIPNVTPGVYTLRASRVGYAPVIIPDVRVAAGAATVVNFRFTATMPNPPNATAFLSSTDVSGIVFCPMQTFVAAYKAGLITTSNDAIRCAGR